MRISSMFVLIIILFSQCKRDIYRSLIINNNDTSSSIQREVIKNRLEVFNNHAPEVQNDWNDIFKRYTYEYNRPGLTHIQLNDLSNLRFNPTIVYNISNQNIRDYQSGNDVTKILQFDPDKCDYYITLNEKFVGVTHKYVKESEVENYNGFAAISELKANVLNDYKSKVNFFAIHFIKYPPEPVTGIGFKDRNGKIITINIFGHLVPLEDALLKMKKDLTNK